MTEFPSRYVLRPPPSAENIVSIALLSQKFATLVDVAERISELKWKWSKKFGGGAKAADSGDEDREYQLAELLHRPWAPSDSKDRAPSTHLREGLYVAEWAGPGSDDFAEPRPWFAVPGLERLVAERLPPEESASSGTGAAGAQSRDKGPIWVEDTVVRAVVRAMLTRPLVLLAGVSGSGKTQLARRLGLAWAKGVFNRDHTVAQAMDRLAHKDNGCIRGNQDDGWTIPDLEPKAELEVLDRFGFIAVQSDWTDASHLWGYHVPLPAEAEGFYGTEALRVFLDAQSSKQRDPQKSQHFLLLDEMNLSRPEHYASDLLSAMEVQGDAVIQLHRAGDKVRLRGARPGARVQEVPRRMAWPEGLVVIGTVNVDETTFSFAPKVLDRAALLEFTDVDLKKAFGTHPLWGAAAWWLEEIHRVCRPYNLHLGYRAAKEVLDALAKSSDAAAVLDLQLCNKVLPRIRGPRASVEKLLLDLLPLAKSRGIKASLGAKPPTSAEARSAYVEKISSDEFKKMCVSERKIAEMLRRAYTVGFTSYFG